MGRIVIRAGVEFRFLTESILTFTFFLSSYSPLGYNVTFNRDYNCQIDRLEILQQERLEDGLDLVLRGARREHGCIMLAGRGCA
jgi:hypothetical protein